MQRLKNYMFSTMPTERMSGLALMHVLKDTTLDANSSVQSSEEQALSPIIPAQMKGRLVTEPMLKIIQTIKCISLCLVNLFLEVFFFFR